MEYRNVGGSDLKVSVLSLGTATFGGTNPFLKQWGETGVEEATRLVDISLEAGVTLFDTADSYNDGLAEEILGKAIAGRRDKLLISTKTAFKVGDGPDNIGTSRRRLMSSVEASLRRLGTDHIDLLQMHAFDALTPIEETLGALDELVRAGKVRYIGCSNFSGWQLMKSLAISKEHGWPRYVANQAYYSLLAREYEWEQMPLGIDQQVGAVVWSPLSGGRLSGKVGRDQPAPAGSRTATQGAFGPSLPQEQFYDLVDVLREIAREVDHSVSQVSLNWLLQRPTVSTLVVGARNEAQLRDNLGATEFKLSAEQIKRLDTVSASEPIYPYWHQRMTYSSRNPAPV